MQKIVNVIAVASGVVSLALVGSGLFVYVNRDSITDSIKQQAIDAAMDALPGLVGGSLPTTTGPVMMDAPPAGTEPSTTPMAGLGIAK